MLLKRLIYSGLICFRCWTQSDDPSYTQFEETSDSNDLIQYSDSECDPTYVPFSSESDNDSDVFMQSDNDISAETSESVSEALPICREVNNDKTDFVPDSCDSDSDHQSIILPSVCAKVSSSTEGVSVAHRAGKNKWDKKHSCKYCQKLVNKMSTYLQRVHANEPEVEAAMKLTKNSKERREAFVCLLQMGIIVIIILS